MWSRKELKEKSKIRFRANYWRSVLVALIVSIIVGAGGMVSSPTFNWHFNDSQQAENLLEDNSPEDIAHALDHGFSLQDSLSIAVFVSIMLVVFLVILAIAIVINVFLLNPLEVGCKRFFVKNLEEDANVKEICYSFDNGYKNTFKTMFFRDLYTFLWSLLFIIPGIIKSYEYRMIPYLLSENPEMPTEQAFVISKQMMSGNKWRAFVLDLSFIGWEILNAFTFGILGIFFVDPYYHQTAAALYAALNNESNTPAQEIPAQNF